jgi:hypothetical protein
LRLSELLHAIGAKLEETRFLSAGSCVSMILTAFQPSPNIACTACRASFRGVAAAQISVRSRFKAKTT